MFLCYEDFESYVCERLSELRSQRNVSARDMSLSMGQGQGYINNIENKKNLPSMKSFYYICEYFNISPKDFFDENTSNPEKINNIIQDLKLLNNEQLTNISAIIKGLIK